jgi:nucleoside-diphosphate-sugar epimerase
MKILVIGASGFVGNSLLKRLINIENIEVMAVSRNIEKASKDFKVSKNINFLNYDLRSDNFSKLNFYPNVIINLSSTQPSSDHMTWDNFLEGNVTTVSSLINYAKSEKIEKIIHLSTSSVFSSSQSPINKDTLPSPDNYYGLSKLLGENLLRISRLKNEFDSSVVVLRFPSMYGDLHHAGLVHTYFTLAKDNRDIELFFEGKNLRNIIFIDDVIDVLEILLTNRDNEAYAAYNLGSKNHLTTYEIASFIKKELNSSSKLIPLKSKDSTNQNVIIDVEKFSKKYNYEAKQIEDSLKRYIKSKKYK